MAFKNLFLKGYSGTDEDDYCVSVYSQDHVYDSLFYTVDQVGAFCLVICLLPGCQHVLASSLL